MINLHMAEIIFIKDLLENELMNLEIKRSKANSVGAFDLTNKERMDYIKQIINKLGGK